MPAHQVPPTCFHERQPLLLSWHGHSSEVTVPKQHLFVVAETWQSLQQLMTLPFERLVQDADLCLYGLIPTLLRYILQGGATSEPVMDLHIAVHLVRSSVRSRFCKDTVYWLTLVLTPVWTQSWWCRLIFWWLVKIQYVVLFTQHVLRSEKLELRFLWWRRIIQQCDNDLIWSLHSLSNLGTVSQSWIQGWLHLPGDIIFEASFVGIKYLMKSSAL